MLNIIVKRKRDKERPLFYAWVRRRDKQVAKRAAFPTGVY